MRPVTLGDRMRRDIDRAVEAMTRPATGPVIGFISDDLCMPRPGEWDAILARIAERRQKAVCP